MCFINININSKKCTHNNYLNYIFLNVNQFKINKKIN